MNSNEAVVRKFQEVLDGTERNLPNPSYTCAVKMERRGRYITRKNNLRKGERDKKRQTKKERENLEHRTLQKETEIDLS